MKTARIRIVSADVVKVDLDHGVAYLAYVLRSPVGDNESAADLKIGAPKEMAAELFEAARNKSALLAEVFSGQKVSPERYQLADFNYTVDRLAPLFTRLADAAKRHAEAPLGESDILDLETDGVHLLRPEYDLDNKPRTDRADILRKRAALYLQHLDPQTAKLMAQRALRLRPDDVEARQLLERCEVP